MARTTLSTRLARANDAIFLREMLYHAALLPGSSATKEEVLSQPSVSAFIDGWGRPGDHGIIAERAMEPIGAGWYRILPDSDEEAGFVGGETPELVIGVEAAHRNQGVGGKLLDALLAKAKDEGNAAIGLTVPIRNIPAVALFSAKGFRVVRDRDGLFTMLADLA